MSTEDERAQLWRDQRARRLAYKLSHEAALAPSPAATLALAEGWRALLPYDRFGVPLVGVEAADDAEEEPCSP